MLSHSHFCSGTHFYELQQCRRFSAWLKVSQDLRMNLQSTVSDGNPSCTFWFVYNGRQTRYCTSTHSHSDVNSGLALRGQGQGGRAHVKLSSVRIVALSSLKCWAAVLQYKLRWDFPCQLMLDEHEWKECILREEICNCRGAGAFHNGS